jgi:hypothetical protein
MPENEISEQFYFYLNGGGVLKSTSDLAQALKTMSSEVFSHHVNQERNDFYNWVKDVFKDKALAAKLKRCKTKESMAKAIEKVPAKKQSEKPADKAKPVHAPDLKKEKILRMLKDL